MLSISVPLFTSCERRPVRSSSRVLILMLERDDDRGFGIRRPGVNAGAGWETVRSCTSSSFTRASSVVFSFSTFVQCAWCSSEVREIRSRVASRSRNSLLLPLFFSKALLKAFLVFSETILSFCKSSDLRRRSASSSVARFASNESYNGTMSNV